MKDYSKLDKENKKKNDNVQTPFKALDLIEPYIPEDSFILDPCCGEGNIVLYFMKHGYKVLGNDIKYNVDFLKIDKNHKILKNITHIITNPPYTLKDEFLEKCYELELPFALLMPVSALGGIKKGKLYQKYGCDIIMPNKRINYIINTKKKNVWFHSCWFTRYLIFYEFGSTIIYKEL